MVLKDNTDGFNLSFNVKVEGFNYTIYATSGSVMKCFGCGKFGHLVHSCPDAVDPAQSGVSDITPAAETVASSADGPVSEVILAEIVTGPSVVPASVNSEIDGMNGHIVTPVLTKNIPVTGKSNKAGSGNAN